MDPFSIFSTLLEAGNTAREIITGLKTKKEEDLKKLSELFAHIGKLLHETFEQLSANQYPSGHCGQIETFGQNIKSEKFHKLLGKTKANELGDMLIAAHEVERLHPLIVSGQIDRKELAKIEEASGHFLAASQLILF